MKRLFTVLFFLLFLTYMGVNIYTAVVNSIKTEPLLAYTAYDKISLNGILIRNEKVLLSDAEGVIDYAVKDGEKVAKNSIVASVYPNEDDIQKRNRIKQIEDIVEDLKYAQSPSGLLVNDPVVIEGMIHSKIENITDSIESGSPNSLYDIKSDIMLLGNRKKLSLGQVQNFNDQIQKLNEEKESLKKDLKNKITDINTSISGFFISNTDGYESTLTPGTVDLMSIEDAVTILNSEGSKKPSEDAVGKIITDFDWYYLAVLDSSVQNKISKGKKVIFSFPIASGQNITMDVENIKTDAKDPSKCLVLFSCDDMIEELNLMRFSTADIIYNSFEGIRVPSSAIRIVDGKKGVYVLIGTQAKFKAINILYEQPDYVVVERKDPLFEKVMPVTPDDEVIVGAKDLYDGKIVK